MIFSILCWAQGMGPGFLINLVRKTDMWFGIIEESHLGQWALTSKTNLDIMNWINCITLQPAKKMYYPVLVEDIQSLKCVQCSEHIMRQNKTFTQKTQYQFRIFS